MGTLVGEKMSLESFKELWWGSPSPTIWCKKYQHPLHRLNPVVLNYEDLLMPFKNTTEEPHEGKTGDVVQLTPEKCYKCRENIRNRGICDPV